MSIKEHLVEVQTDVGTFEFIKTSRKNRPKGLVKPYEYEVSIENTKLLHGELKTLLIASEKICQVSFIQRKTVSRGVRLGVFILAYAPGLCGPLSNLGLTQTQWNKLRKDVQNIFFKYLGKDARIYAEKYSKDKKFQLRFQTYIAYSELH